MKTISPKDLTDLLNQEGGIPEGEEVQFSALVRGIGNTYDNDAPGDNKYFFLYEGHASLISCGNGEYIFKGDRTRLKFTQNGMIRTDIGHTSTNIYIPTNINPETSFLAIYNPKEIKH